MPRHQAVKEHARQPLSSLEFHHENVNRSH
jgi:hypothetical protein